MKTGTAKTERNVNVTEPTEGEYKGSPMLSIPTDDPKWPITMGAKKWGFIVAHLDAIKGFVAKHNIVEDTEAAACAALGITKEQLAALKGGK